jgi:hypothetical protein
VDGYVYRGPDAVESSRACEQRVERSFAGGSDGPAAGSPTTRRRHHRRRLNRMKTGKPVRGGVRSKAELRRVGERAGLIDLQTGALRTDNLTVSIDATMASAGDAERGPRAPRITLTDMLNAGALEAGCRIYDDYKDKWIYATLERDSDTGEARVRLGNGSVYGSLSTASKAISREENGWARFGSTQKMSRCRRRGCATASSPPASHGLNEPGNAEPRKPLARFTGFNPATFSHHGGGGQVKLSHG